MTDINKLYYKNLILDLIRHKAITGICILLGAVLCTFLGYTKVNNQELLEQYNTSLKEYDDVIADVEESLVLSSQQVEEMEEYVDHSIYMLLDGQNIQSASIQYAISTEANLGNIFNALIYYVNEGGLRESLGDEHADLDVKYWRDVVSCATGGNIFSVTVMHYDAEKAKAILNLVDERLRQQVSVISQVEGAFTLQELSTSYYTKADVNVTNTQNNHLNTLKGYLLNRADFTSRLISSQSGKTEHIKNNLPVLLGSDPSGAAITILSYLVIGILLGLAIPLAGFSLRNVLLKRVRSEEDLAAFSLHPIGPCHTKDNREEALQRGLVELTYFKEHENLPSIYFDILSEHDLTDKMVADYEALLVKHHIFLKTGRKLQEDATELQDLMAAGACILVVQVGKTTYPQIQKQIELCNTFHINILGCIAIA